MGGEHAGKIRKTISYNGHCRVDATGFSGGIWLYWRPEIVNVVPVYEHSQFITVEVSRTGGVPWFFTAVYASPDPTNRRELWSELENFAHTNGCPWILARDFNETRSLSKRHGEFAGLSHTWARGNSPETRQSTRLDRALCNTELGSYYDNASVRHLPAFQSDHCPLLIALNGFTPLSSVQKPFRFQAAWMTHELFSTFIEENWPKYGRFPSRLNALSTSLQNWNENVFGNIFRKKKSLMARIEGCQKKPSTVKEKRLIALEATLRRGLDKILEQEEIYWDTIMECVTSARMQVLWNGEPTELFTPTRGVRQGDPLSSYLFVMCLEKLQQAIDTEFYAGKWRPILVCRNGPAINNLFFADDMVLFGEATVE
ncbi:hypothetical protein RND81_09G059800 [Saponaria officinalis]|uniref:Reverse transcriptase domain-containing protein n=1 Tax=Saponaria officinalis TaxID=3572 RepID=A0AAW1IJ96_SAPOF